MKKTIKLLHTSDIHGHILPIDYANNQPQDIGLAKIATLIDEYPLENTLIIDTGDILQGSPMMHILQTNDNYAVHPIAKSMNAMHYHYFVPGNHDFNFGQDHLYSFINQLEATTLCANIKTRDGENVFDRPYTIHKTEDGIKLAIIGLTTEYIPNWEHPSHIHNLQFHSVIETLRTLLPEVKSHKPHAIIVAYHGGFEKDLDTFQLTARDTKENVGSAIIEEFPEIDVLLTGHQHRKIHRYVRNVLVSQPGSKGQFLAEVTLDFDHQDEWELSNKAVKLLSTETIPASSKIENLVAKEEQITQQNLDQVIGQVSTGNLLIEDQFLARIEKHPIVTLINKIQLQTSGAMISCMSLANESSGFEHNITVRNVFSTYPFPNTLSVLKIHGNDLKKALEENAKYFTVIDGYITISKEFNSPKEQHYNYDMFDGIEYTIKVSNPVGQRIVSLSRNNQPIKDDDEFTLVVNNYRASGGGDFEIFKDLDVVKELPQDVPILIIDYIKKVQTINPDTKKNITIIQ